MEHATRIKAFALGCALLAAGGVAAHLWGASSSARADAPLAVQECTLRTPIDTTVYFGTSPGTRWSKVQDYMADAGITFDYGSSTLLNVRLCGTEGQPSCRPFLARIQSERSNTCLTREIAEDGRLRMLGRLWTPRNTPVATGARWGFSAQSATGEVYLLLRGTTAYAMYDSAGVTQFAPAGVWSWSFCPDGMTARHPKGEWRQIPTGDTQPPCGMGTDTVPSEEDPTELTSYGWMACVNGCCRFYGSPPPPGNPEPRPRPDRPRGGE